MLRFIEKTKLWFTISTVIILIGFFSMATKGLEFGIDFKGGTVVQIDMGKDFNKAEVDEIIKKYTNDAQTNKAINEEKKTTELEIKSNSITSENIASMFKEIKEKYSLKDNAIIFQDTIGASIGNELMQKALIALTIAILAMLAYIAFRFEFNFGIAALVALIHDVLLALSVYAIFSIPVNSGFVAAMLTIIGYSINDTIVVFDRIRENQKHNRRMDEVELANSSITQTMARSINTGLSVLITLTLVYIYVPTVRDFSVPLLVGIVSGTYSSIFIATPTWVILRKRKKAKRAVA